MSTDRACSYCGKGLTSAYFSPYALLRVPAPEEGEVPIFCGEVCMIRFVSRHTKEHYLEVLRDFRNYCYVSGGDKTFNRTAREGKK